MSNKFTDLNGEDGVPTVKLTLNPLFLEGKTVIVSRVYHPSPKPHDLGVMTREIRNFPGIQEREPIYMGRPGNYTSEIVSIQKKISGDTFLVYLCKTRNGSWYEVIAAV